MQSITPFLWFDTQAEDAANYYTSIFGGKILNLHRNGDGSVLVANFEIRGQKFIALNGGPQFKFTEAVSFVIDCEDQNEVDHFWDSLTADGGEESYCGWLKDKYGLSWQVIPKRFNELMSDPDPEKGKRVFEAMMKMRKMVVAEFEAAAEGAHA